MAAIGCAVTGGVWHTGDGGSWTDNTNWDDYIQWENGNIPATISATWDVSCEGGLTHLDISGSSSGSAPTTSDDNTGIIANNDAGYLGITLSQNYNDGGSSSGGSSSGGSSSGDSSGGSGYNPWSTLFWTNVNYNIPTGGNTIYNPSTYTTICSGNSCFTDTTI